MMTLVGLVVSQYLVIKSRSIICGNFDETFNALDWDPIDESVLISTNDVSFAHPM